MDGRTAMAEGTRLTLQNGKGGRIDYTVGKEIGRGGSSIVYDGHYETTTGDKKLVRIKECYPVKLRLSRRANGQLAPEPEDEAAFAEELTRFRQDFRLGNGLFYAQGLYDALVNTIDLCDCNGTAYLVSVYTPESTLASYRPKNLHLCVTLANQVAQILGLIHSQGYLYLDIKPENVLVLDSYTTRVQLFDLDSLVPIDSLGEHQRTSFTRGFAAIELQTGRGKRLGRYTDVYGLGALLFWLIFGRTPTAGDCEPDAVYDFSHSRYGQEPHRDRLYAELTDFFHRSLANFYLDRYTSMDQTVEKLTLLQRLADPHRPCIHSTRLLPTPTVGRERELQKLQQWMADPQTPCLFVTGMGGMGKSTLVRTFAGQEQLDSLLWLTWQGSLPRTLADDRAACIQGIRQEQGETLEDYYVRKLALFRELVTGTRALLVLDDHPGEIDSGLTELLNVGWKVVCISRKTPEGCPVLPLGPIEDQQALYRLFETNLGAALEETDYPYVDTIIRQVQGHTLVLELMAKQIASSYLTVAQAARLAAEYGFSHMGAEKVSFRKDDSAHLETVQTILTALFQADSLSRERQDILKVLSLTDSGGVDMGLLDVSREESNGLVRDGWVVRSGTVLSLHPVIRETVGRWDWSEPGKAHALWLLDGLRDAREPDMGLCVAVLTSCRREEVLRREPVYRDLLWRTVSRLPRDREDFVLAACRELLKTGPKGNEAMLLYRNILDIYQQRQDYEEGTKVLAQAKALAERDRSSALLARYYEMEGAFCDCLLDGCYDETGPEKGRIIQAILYATDRTIFYARQWHDKEGQLLLAESLLAKATLLIRGNRPSRWKIDRLLRQASKIPVTSLRLRLVDALTRAWYDTVVAGDFGETTRRLQTARELARENAATDLDFIDDYIVPASDMLCIWGRYEQSARLLLEGVALCEKNDTLVPCIRKKVDLHHYLLDVYLEAGNRPLCRRVMDQLEAFRRQYAHLGIG